MRDEAKARIDRAVLYLYRNAFSEIMFPVQPEKVVHKLTLCRYITYAELARVSGKTLSDVSRACNSSDGCTHYDPRTNRYLMAINTSGRSRARTRWTTAHELGHIAADHFVELVNDGRLEASPSELVYMEEEADYFAASFLAPFPAIRMVRAKSPGDIRAWFGLSQIASEYRWSEFLKNTETGEIDRFFNRYAGGRPREAVKLESRAIDIWADCEC